MDKSDLKLMSTSLRMLCANMVEKAKSGHPGLPLGMADVATVLYANHLNYNPEVPYWENRDRFILSAGYGSALLYALLHLTGYQDISMNDLMQFRQYHSRTAGHPEYGLIEGVETTTGPLGQGFANAVGMAVAEQKMANRIGSDRVDHHTYVVVGDGCLMEGISYEAASLAGHLGLHKLIVLWDSNKITIDGSTSLSTSEDIQKRFQACGWNTLEVDGHNYSDIDQAIDKAKKSEKPTLIQCNTVIGKGAPTKSGTEKVHGSPLGEDEIKAMQDSLGWSHPPFYIPQSVYDLWKMGAQRSAPKYKRWKEVCTEAALTAEHAAELQSIMHRGVTADKLKSDMLETKPAKATRAHSQDFLANILSDSPEIIGGSADLTPSNNTKASGMKNITRGDFSGQYIHYGIREHAMGAIMNGISLYGRFKVYGGTFFCFSDYMRPSMRLAALMKLPVTYVMTHDSIGVGEDGPTHQPVEHLASFRAMPNINVFRPADGIETVECWELALSAKHTPSILALSRQAVPAVRKKALSNSCSLGGYVISDCETPQVTLIATGTEVHLAVDAQEELKTNHNINAKVVSMPCMDLFEIQPETYKNKIFGNCPRLGIEAGTEFGWEKYVDKFIGINTFGESAPANKLFEHFGITTKNIVEQSIQLVEGKKQ